MSNMPNNIECNPKRHDVMFHDKIEVCSFCGMKLYPNGDYGRGLQN